MQTEDWFSLAELTARLGSLVWVEEQLADLLRAWSAIEPEPSAAIVFASAAGHHKWHAEIIRGCLPTSPQLDADSAVQAPTNGWQTTMATLGSFTDPDSTVTRLKVLAKVVDPWLQREIGALYDLARPVSDAAMMRWLRFVLLDHDDDGGAVARLLDTRTGDPVRFEDHVLVNEIDLS